MANRISLLEEAEKYHFCPKQKYHADKVGMSLKISEFYVKGDAFAMKAHQKIICIVLAVLFFAVILSACDNNTDSNDTSEKDTEITTTEETKQQTYTVVWKNHDGTVLEKDENLELGAIPKYDGILPEKAADYEYTYVFYHWDKEISPVTGDAEYTAQFRVDTIIRHEEGTITWKNYDGTVLKIETDDYDAFTACGSFFMNEDDEERFIPTKPADSESDQYYFCGWEPLYQDGGVIYTAKFNTTPTPNLLLPKMISKEAFETKILATMRENIYETATVTISDGTIRDEDGFFIFKNTTDWPLGVVGETYNYYDLVLMHDPDFDMAGECVLKYDCFEVRKVAAYYAEKNLDKAVSDREAESILAAFPITEKMAVYVFDPMASLFEQLTVEKYIEIYAPDYTFEELEKDHALVEYKG